MAMRSPAGFISAFFDPLKNPDAPTSPSASAGDTTASVSFTAPTNVGGSAITAYYAVANDGTTASAASSPVTVTGLTNGTSYTFNVWALNSYGPGVWSATTGAVTPAANPNRGLFAGGNADTVTIEYITISSTGNGTSFGSLSTALSSGNGGCGSTTRGIIGGGNDGGRTSVIQYLTFATTGNATSFGVLTVATEQLTAFNSTTRAVFSNGSTGGYTNVMTYVTIATTGNSVSFGQSLITHGYWPAGFSSSTRGLTCGGSTSATAQSLIDYVTIATTGNATSFGNLNYTTGLYATCGASNSTRGLIANGIANDASDTNQIKYVTIATTGNSLDFGTLSSAASNNVGVSNSTRAVFNINANTGYVTIATTGNATSFGSLISSRKYAISLSSANGGTQ